MTMPRSSPAGGAVPPSSGVFSSEMLRHAVAAGVIRAPKNRPILDGQFQPASLDLRLGATAHRLRSSFLPGADATVKERLRDLEMGPASDLRDPRGVVLERGRPYLVPLIETFRLPGNVRGRTNPRSSTGRLDIFTRVITDHGVRFDEIPRGYQGGLWLEVYSNTFTVSVKEGLALAQVRLSDTDEVLRGDAIRRLHDDTPLLFEPGDGNRAPVANPLIGSDGLFVSVSLPANEFVGWRAKSNSGLVELDASAVYEPLDFWEPIFGERGGRLVLHPEQFYLLISREHVSIPPTVAAEMVAYDPTNGELRTHYAGFFDPGFGYGPEDLRGTRAVLEVRAHDVPFMLEDRQPVARLAYERMAAEPARLYGDAAAASHFQRQDIAFSRQFKPPVFDFRMPSTARTWKNGRPGPRK
ncbi:MAG: 2'-deoxycytidine 5'-triphosphate deaminase [Tepidiformaceae bacterium]